LREGGPVWIEGEAYAALGICLADVRKRAGVTQDELAERLDKPQSFISAYERGQRRVDILELLVILRALKVDPQEVLAAILRLKAPGRRAAARPRGSRPGS
jgi:transcriptional regulator with XRE-family HTH domain